MKPINKKPWRAEYQHGYFYIDMDLFGIFIGKSIDVRDGSDNITYEKGNYFKTKVQAKRKLSEIMTVLKKGR